MEKQYRELTFADDFMFGKVLRDNEDLTKEIAEIVTGRQIARISIPHKQYTIEEFASGKGVRFDVYFSDDQNTRYDFEMQTTRARNLPRRSRYYHSMADTDSLKRSQDYWLLPDSYIVFFCLTDPFSAGYAKYVFENHCKEPDVYLADGAYTIFLNASAVYRNGGLELENLLDYLAGKPAGGIAEKIDEAVQKAHDDEKGERIYMTILERDARMKEEGIQQGLQQGRKQGRVGGVIEGTILTCRSFGLSEDEIRERIKRDFKLTDEEAERYIQSAEH